MIKGFASGWEGKDDSMKKQKRVDRNESNQIEHSKQDWFQRQQEESKRETEEIEREKKKNDD
jgi:hypothetical protein